MSNSISPLLTPVDVLAYQNSVLSLSYDEVSDLIFYQGAVWFVWQKFSGGNTGKIGIASCNVDSGGNLVNLKEWLLPIPPGSLKFDAESQSPDFKIFTVCGGRLITVLTMKGEAKTVVFSFSPNAQCWYLGAYGAATRRFRFHVIEKAEDISADKFAAASLASNLVLYTHDGEMYAGFDNTRYHQDDWLRTPEVSKMLDLSFFQKIKVLLPNAAPFIFLNSPVAWDEQIKEPAGGKALYLPALEQRVLLIYNYESLLTDGIVGGADGGSADISVSSPGPVKFKWPGLVNKTPDFYEFVFAVSQPKSKYRLLSFRIPSGIVETSSLSHQCEQDIFSCVAGFCKILKE